MAYINQENKKKIAEELKKVIPRDIKWSLSIKDHATLHLNIKSVPESFKFSDPVEMLLERNGCYTAPALQHHVSILQDSELFDKIATAMNIGNHDRSNAQVDHFDVGFYTRINFGRWDKPLIRG